jgi:hypothetical protein
MILLGFGNPESDGTAPSISAWLLYPRICFQVHLPVLQTSPQPLDMNRLYEPVPKLLETI